MGLTIADLETIIHETERRLNDNLSDLEANQAVTIILCASELIQMKTEKANKNSAEELYRRQNMRTSEVVA